MTGEKTLRVKHGVLFIDKLKTIKTAMDSLIYLSSFNFLLKLLILDLLVFSDFLH